MGAGAWKVGCLVFKMSCQRKRGFREGHEDPCTEDSQGCLKRYSRLAGARETHRRHPECLPPRLLGCTVVEDSQGLFRKHREEELEERRNLYR